MNKLLALLERYSSSKPFLFFVSLNSFPFIVFTLWFLISSMLESDLGGGIVCVLFFGFLSIPLLGLFSFVYSIFRRLSFWFSKWLVLFGVWFLFYKLISALASLLDAGYQFETGIVKNGIYNADAHIALPFFAIIVPWTIICILILRKFAGTVVGHSKQNIC